MAERQKAYETIKTKTNIDLSINETKHWKLKITFRFCLKMWTLSAKNSLTKLL